ncbi:hypothetical protein G7Y89_g3400 [Cudoniella acicularis]|uniref:HTH psq-type domain-containing protein n=1 Tax=Cudoniella acicularis TaxID=354080 RepID=A0A8H4RUF1_9HELO|nr:hypothetical protein G7Y89_g3400 [Cudoniella acicularis]
MSYEDRMQKALAELKSLPKPNYAMIARKYDLERTTLAKRAKGQTTSREQFQSESHRCLTNAQERVLINQINHLTERGIPPTSQMVKNFAEEMIGRERLFKLRYRRLLLLELHGRQNPFVTF